MDVNELVEYTQKALLELGEKTVADSKNTGLWQIKIDGSVITTKSGKSSWRQIGHAKNALKYHFSAVHDEIVYKKSNNLDMTYRDADRLYEDQYEAFVAEHVEFVNVV